jgi:hypothetical protein
MVILSMTSIAISAQTDQNFAQIQRQNAEELKQYSWKSRTEVKKAGDTKNVQLNLMRYDVQGVLQKTPISSTPQQQLPTHGLRGRIAQKKKGDFIEMLETLASLARSYGELSPEKSQRFMASTVVVPETSAQQQKLLRIKGNDVLQPGDSMTVWVDAATRMMRKVEIQTALEKKLVRIVSDFQNLPQGPTYMARSVIEYPGEELTVITENFDYERVRQ